MAPLTNVTSRAASARASRAGSTARDIVKKRDKLYKTERKRILTKKRKLDLHTAYNKALPRGYTFLPVGTPDLAERCKEISRQKGYSVNVVNARPVSKYANDPEKVSHHIARIGYHFRSDVVDEAREQLGYILFHGDFVKEAEFEKQRADEAQHSAVARAFAKYNVSADGLRQQPQRETPDKVCAAIKELFPRIPDRDLSEILRHAWQEGTSRVGTNSDLELPRRVQLATIARIRHTYTDYDRLLRAFEWKEARSMVEQECLQKLIEWRGENDEEDDNELEEIVRETIVIDDDDDAPADVVSEADDEDSVTEIEPGDTSDASIEIVQHGAAETDFGAESTDDRARRLVDRYRPRQPQHDMRHALAKQKIGAVRERIRAGAPIRYPMPPTQGAPHTPDDRGDMVRIHIQPDQNGQYPAEVMVDGRRMRAVAPVSTPQQIARPSSQLPPAHNGSYDHSYIPVSAHNRVPVGSHSLLPLGRPNGHHIIDRPVTSIERDDHHTPPNNHTMAASLHPVTPDSGHVLKRRRVDAFPPSPRDHEQRPARVRNGGDVEPLPADVEVIDLLSPPRAERGTQALPMVLDEDERDAGQYVPVQHGSAMHTRPLARSASYVTPSLWHRGQPAEPPQPPYDLRRPDLPPGEPHFQYAPVPGPMRYVQVQLVAQPNHGYARPPLNGSEYASPHYQRSTHAPHEQSAAAQPALYPWTHQQPERLASHPVHGAPAPVQQAPIGAPTHGSPPNNPGYVGGYGATPGYGASANGQRSTVHQSPVDGAAAPTQYYHAR